MPYVQYDQSGAVTGLYANPQPGFAETFLAPTDPAVIAYLSPPPTSGDVDTERDRRIAQTFSFQGHLIQLDSTSQLNVTAAGAAARFAVIGGAVAGNLRWSDPNTDFGWIATDNTIVPMDAPTMVAMSAAAMAWVSSNTFAAHAIKATTPISTAYATDSRWPAPA